MQYEYAAFKLVNQVIDADANELQEVFETNTITLYCELHFDTDPISDTYGKWICCLDLVSDTEDVAQRSIVLYSNTLHFEGDNRYTVAINSDLDNIGHDDLGAVILVIGVPV